MVQTGGDQYSSVIELRDSGEDVDIPLPKRFISNWKRVSKIFKVTTGKIKAGIYSCARV